MAVSSAFKNGFAFVAEEGKELEKYKAIAGESLFRFYVGLEDADDLIGDLKRILG
jgi:cystathionine beta-lyase/cystathionine gamma-synthase